MSENFAEMFEQSITQMNMRVGEIITGEVVDINRDVVIVNAGPQIRRCDPGRTVL